MERRLPIYLIIDTSGDMAGEPIEEVRKEINGFVTSLLNEPQALETVWLSIITYNNHAEIVVPLCSISSFDLPDIQTGGLSSLGSALTLLQDSINNDIRKGNIENEEKGDWKPLVLLIVAGNPTDDWEQALSVVNRKRIGEPITFCVSDECDKVIFEKIIGSSNNVIFSSQISEKTIKQLNQLFRWITQSINTTNFGNTNEQISIPPPPKDDELDVW